jgi:hypothetical protein
MELYSAGAGALDDGSRSVQIHGAQRLQGPREPWHPCQRVQSLASAGRIEVEFHDWDPDDPKVDRIHEAASEVPWEYLISAATRVEGRFGSLLISRLFRNGMSAVPPHPPSTVLFVESAPGRIKELYEFSDEEERIRVPVGADRRECVKILNTPKLSELRTATEKNWEAIHVTGIDTHQAGWLIENFYEDFPKQKLALWKEITRSDRLRDGMIMREGREIELPVPYDKLAKALVGAKPAPRIVTLNLYYSGAVSRGSWSGSAHIPRLVFWTRSMTSWRNCSSRHCTGNGATRTLPFVSPMRFSAPGTD